MDSKKWLKLSEKEQAELLDSYRMTFDYHTHTVFSHGKGTIEDNVKVAVSKGLDGIAISDHGPGHLTYGLDVGKIPEMKKEIQRLATAYPQIKILLGVEANTVMREPFVDISAEESREFDFVMAGYHYGVRKSQTVSNYLHRKLGVSWHSTADLLVKNTDMIIRALYESEERGIHIFALTHPGDKGPFDIEDIAKVCSDTGTYLEINNSHRNLSTEGIMISSEFDVKYIIGSDAHVPQKVGEYKDALSRAFEAGLDLSRIVNIEKKVKRGGVYREQKMEMRDGSNYYHRSIGIRKE